MRSPSCAPVSRARRPQILIVSACVSLGISYMEESDGEDWLSKWVEPGVIVLILILNAAVGVAMVRAPLGAPANRHPKGR